MNTSDAKSLVELLADRSSAWNSLWTVCLTIDRADGFQRTSPAGRCRSFRMLDVIEPCSNVTKRCDILQTVDSRSPKDKPVLKFLLRCGMFIAGVVLLLDIGLPTSAESLQVDQHTSSVDRRASGGIDSRWADTNYTIHFVGGRLSSCSVGYSTYAKLKDGDTVGVQATRLFKNCIRITRADEVLEAEKHWKLFALIGGCILIAAAIGWLETNDDGSVHLF